jgi:lipid II:glycine glycyltransferase (peptidoglycan interpeptide bridge formation enzyme)
MTLLNATQWDEFLADYPNIHLLQTSAWGELKSQFGWSCIRLKSNNTGVQILFRKIPFIGRTIAYIPKGPVGPDLGPDFWSAVDQVCRKQHAVYLKVEPDFWEDQPGFDPDRDLTGFILSDETIQPPQTILIDLTGTEEDILGRMKQKTRYNVHLAEKKGIVIRPLHDLSIFYQMMKVTGGRDQFGVHSQAYYQKAFNLYYPEQRCEILSAEFNGKPLAALMIFKQGRRAYYLYGASTDEERNRMPTYLLQWEAMRWARTNGCDEYDLWGIPDAPEDELEEKFTERHDGLWGVYRFKRGFGGKIVRSVGPYDRVYSPGLYQVYQAVSGIRRGR